MPEVTDYQLFQAMARYGGSFARAIAAADRADAKNMARLKAAFPELMEEFRQAAVLVAARTEKEDAL